MPRFHISISVDDYDVAVADYSQRLGHAPDSYETGRYARWRTDQLNFTISCKSGQPAGKIRHIGFEDNGYREMREEKDSQGIVWEYFSKEVQDAEIKARFEYAVFTKGTS